PGHPRRARGPLLVRPDDDRVRGVLLRGHRPFDPGLHWRGRRRPGPGPEPLAADRPADLRSGHDAELVAVGLRGDPATAGAGMVPMPRPLHGPDQPRPSAPGRPRARPDDRRPSLRDRPGPGDRLRPGGLRLGDRLVLAARAPGKSGVLRPGDEPGPGRAL